MTLIKAAEEYGLKLTPDEKVDIQNGNYASLFAAYGRKTTGANLDVFRSEFSRCLGLLASLDAMTESLQIDYEFGLIGEEHREELQRLNLAVKTALKYFQEAVK